MNSKIILKFEYDNIWYYVEKDNTVFKYYFLKDGEKNYSLTNEQFKIVDTIFNSIKPSKEYLKITKYKYNNVIYDVILDKKTKLYFFNPIPKKKDLIYLNYLFNNQNEYLANDTSELDKSEHKFFKRIANFFSKKIVLYIECSLIVLEIGSYLYLADATSYDTKDYLKEVEITSKVSDEDLYLDIYHAIDSNEKLKEDEKEYFFDFIGTLVRDKEYLNIDYICKTLNTIYIEYDPSSKRTEAYKVSGQYSPSLNKIVFYEVNNISEVYKNITYHEIAHSFTKYEVGNFNSFLLETVNTLYSVENVGEEERSSYMELLNYTKGLIELIGIEPFKRYKGYDNEEFLIDVLCEYIDDRDKAISFLKTLDIYKKTYEKYLNDIENEELKDNKIHLENMIFSYFSEYYKAKYNREIETDLLMLYYTNYNSFCAYFEEINAESISGYTVIPTKKYFKEADNTNYLVCYKTITEYEQRGESTIKTLKLHSFNIDEENRYLEDDFALG